ncbi:MAG TPA: DoxX family protein [Opitutaceae bacterium]
MIQAHQPEIAVHTPLRATFRWVLAVFFVVAGANHFRSPATYLGMIPPWLPWPEGLNAISGACEILGGVGILVPRMRMAAGWGLVALLVAVFPANLHVALMGRMPGFDFSATTLWLRLPLQAALVAWVAWVAIAGNPRRS